MKNQDLGPGALKRIDKLMAKVMKGLHATGGDILKALEDLGGQLLDLLIPDRWVRASLRLPGLFLEVGIDESLVEYPWELMHDGEEFLCLKHSMGRFVNGSNAPSTEAQETGWWGAPLRPLKVLLLSVPRAKWPDEEFPELPHAVIEADTIRDFLSDIDTVDLLDLSRRASSESFYDAVKKHRPHFIHFCGHAKFHSDEPDDSCLVLPDGPLDVGTLTALLKNYPPIFCFINACESTKTAGENGQFNFGLARAFLESGAYLLGSRWKITDTAAASFAPRFYAALLDEGRSVGQAIQDARKACKETAAKDPSWASYIYYGDPRVYFRRDGPILEHREPTTGRGSGDGEVATPSA